MKLMYAGSFDPLTKGHCDIISKASALGRLYIVVASNPEKKYLLPLEIRHEIIKKTVGGNKSLEILFCEGMASDVARDCRVDYFVRGVRSTGDFLYEQELADINRALCGIDTLLLFPDNWHRNTSSTLARELIRCKKPLDSVLHGNTIKVLKERDYV